MFAEGSPETPGTRSRKSYAVLVRATEGLRRVTRGENLSMTRFRAGALLAIVVVGALLQYAYPSSRHPSMLVARTPSAAPSPAATAVA
jgi:hypothetical protein